MTPLLLSIAASAHAAAMPPQVMDRRTNASRLLTADASFVNNHFVNPYEEGDQIVVDW